MHWFTQVVKKKSVISVHVCVHGWKEKECNFHYFCFQLHMRKQRLTEVREPAQDPVADNYQIFYPEYLLL